jgi:hypothetical protein
MVAASLRALLCGAIDYAGLFPPATLTLEPALRNYAEYVRSAESWMLGAFILPWEKFEESAASLTPFDVEHCLRVSALGPKTDNAPEFLGELAAGVETIRAFDAQHGATAAITQIEMPLPSEPGASLADTNRALGGLNVPTFWEANVDDAERAIGFVAEHRATGAGRFGFKLRTGGVIASAFPSSIQVARALVAAAAQRVPIKFTAGLHHPVRQFHASVQTKMHGFLNVLGAGVLAAENRWDVQQVAAMLEDEDSGSFVFADDGFAWREWKIATNRIEAGRKLVTSFGSCSFDEPRDDLRALNLL